MMDNLISHKVKDVIDPIIAAGVTVRYLLPYSHDLNPIEMMWSKKTVLRKMKARTEKALEDAIAGALRHITISDIRGWFAEDGLVHNKRIAIIHTW